MNRHHYALFVHNTKLVFLLRKESETSNDLEVFKPAEWRWELDEINDGLWHHYAFSMDFPEVSDTLSTWLLALQHGSKYQGNCY